MKKKLIADLMFICSLVLLIIGFEFNITGNLIRNYFFEESGILHLIGFVLFIGSFLFFIERKSLEAVVVPTSPSYKADSQRAKAGIKEYNKNKSRLIIISGEVDERNGERKFIGSQPMKIYKQMRKEGIPKDHFIFESHSHNTKENALYVTDKIKKLNKKGKEIGELIIVTDKPQAKRFEMLFNLAKKEGVAPKNLEIKTYSKDIEKTYGPIKANLAYIKDYLTFRKEIKEYKKKHQ